MAGGEADVDAALELWLKAFQAAISDEDLETQAAQLADRALKAVLGTLDDARPITLADVEHALVNVLPDWVDDDDVPVLIAAEIAEAIELFRRLHHCGAISPTGPQPPEQLTVALTPLGVCSTREYLLGTGCDAAVIAG